ncbi:MAG: peptidase M48 Ste24p [Parcubacteria group bacterium Greene0416_14]|nr:MAG: peptidase M48 Ste24p [Parcubacteria group bacterium Greene0416_14]
MPTKLVLASFYTLGLLFGFLAAIILSIMYFFNVIDAVLLLILTVAINFFIWLFGPYITDFIHRIFYKMKFLSREEFQQLHPDLHEFIAQVTAANKIHFPKIGLIDDDNPTAYTYGSGAFNARIIFTKGLFTYLQPEEIRAVIAHEIGHIVHRDFIVMAIANMIIQLLYEISEIFMKRRSPRRSSGDRDKESGYLFIIGLAAYIFYIIGFYLVLFLNRMREVYADDFAARTIQNPNVLSNALIKIAYGIMAKEETAQSLRLMESTRTLGIMGFRTAKEAGLVAKVTNMEPAKVAKVFLYDVVSPWAKLAELGSTHPLTGRRLARLDGIAESMGQQSLFNIPRILAENPVDKNKLWSGFFSGIFINYLPWLVLFVLVLSFAFTTFLTESTNAQGILAFWAAFFGLSFIVRAMYRYPSIKISQNTEILSLMSDLYATPVHGKPITLQGSVVGRGTAGYVFSEDMMFQDNTGLMYLDYKAGIPLIGDVIFAWKKVKQLFGQSINVRGWFFRSNLQYVVLDSLQYDSSFLRSYAKFWNFAIGIFALVVSATLLFSQSLETFYYIAGGIGIILIFVYGSLRKKNKILSRKH